MKSNVLPNMQLPKSQNLTSNSLCDTSSIIINKYASPFNIESQPSNPHTQPSNFVLQNNRRKKFGDTSTMPVNLIKRFANRTSASNSFVQSDGENRKHQTNENVVPGPSTNSNCVFGPSTNSNFCFVLLQNQMLHLVVVLQQWEVISHHEHMSLETINSSQKNNEPGLSKFSWYASRLQFIYIYECKLKYNL